MGESAAQTAEWVYPLEAAMSLSALRKHKRTPSEQLATPPNQFSVMYNLPHSDS